MVSNWAEKVLLASMYIRLSDKMENRAMQIEKKFWEEHMGKYSIAVLLVLFAGCAGTPDESSQGDRNFTPVHRDYTVQKGIDMDLSKGDGLVQGVNEFFEQIGIAIKPGERLQFIVGDNIAGYFEGYTQGYRRGEGWLMKNQTLFRNYATFAGGKLNNRGAGNNQEWVLPYGNRVEYPQGTTEEMVLMSGKYVLAIEVTSSEPEILSVIPFVRFGADNSILEEVDGITVLSPSTPNPRVAHPPYLAFWANQDFSIKSTLSLAPTDAEDILKLRDEDGVYTVASQNPTQKFTLYLAFGFTPAEAATKARSMGQDWSLDHEKEAVYKRLTKSHLWTDNLDYNRALVWSKASAWSMVVEEFGKGIWAGLPWFKDNWGRDTFIALPGTLLTTGLFEHARGVIENFSNLQNTGTAELTLSFTDESQAGLLRNWVRETLPGKRSTREEGIIRVALTRDYVQNPALLKELEEKAKAELTQAVVKVTVLRDKDYGRVPNRVASLNDIIYNTTDGTPWMVREVLEYLRYTGDKDFAQRQFPVIQTYIEGALKNYVDSDGLLTHEEADTWMDAKIAGKLPWSARGSRASDIQALWITSLEVGAFLAQDRQESELARQWTALADKARASFIRLFWDGEVLADRIRQDNTPDKKVRPNQLMVVSIPFEKRMVPPEVEAAIVKNSVKGLLYSYGIASLNQEDPYFHPIHENIRYHHKDAAYHNGTIWGWNAGFTISAMNRYGYQDLAWELTKNLTDQILSQGTLGSMSENMNALPDEKGVVKLSGTYSQAWSVSEFSRSGYQDFVGFRPNLIQNSLTLFPAIPAQWKEFQSRLPFGLNNSMDVVWKRGSGSETWSIKLKDAASKKLYFQPLTQDGSRYEFEINLRPAEETLLKWNGEVLEVNGRRLAGKLLNLGQKALIGELEFLQPKTYRPEDFPMLQKKNVLQGIIERGEYR